MTRETFEKNTIWRLIMKAAGLCNACALMPQLYTTITTWKTDGVSLSMFALFLFIQSSFMIRGIVGNDRILWVSMAVTGTVNICIITLVAYIRLTA